MNDVHVDTLPNGLRILVAEDHNLPIVCSTLWYRAGTRTEPAGQSGISHFLEHLMYKGTAKFPKGATDAVTLSLGGHDNAFTSYDYTGYYFTFAADRWEVALEIEADRMRSLLFSPDEFEAEKQVVMEELTMGEDNPWEFLRRNVIAAAYRRHPYRNPIIGWKEDLEALTLEQVRDYYHRFYHPANAILVITGDVKADDTFRLVRRHFGKIPGGQAPEISVHPEPLPDGMIQFQADKPAHVSRLLLAFHGPSARDPRIHAADLLRYILSEGKTSRLYHRLVERDQSASSFSVYFEDMKDPALIMLSAELRENVDFPAVEDAIKDELAKLVKDGVTEAELKRASRQLTADFIFEKEDITNVAVNLGVYECIGSHRIYLDFLDQANRVTAEDIRAVAAHFLDPRRCVTGRLPAGATGEGDEEPAGSADEAFAGISRAFRRGAPPSAGQPAALRPKPAARGHGVGVHLPVRSHRLANGLQVLICPLPRIPAITVSAVVLAGGREDPDDLPGLGYLVGNLLDEGTSSHDHAELSAFIDDVGGTMESFGSREASGITMKLLKEDFPPAMEFLQEMIYESVFPVDRIDLTRAQVISRIQSLEDRPDYLGSREFHRIIYQGTPLAQPLFGDPASLNRIRQEHLRAFHRRHFHAGNTILVIVGDLDPEETLAMVERDWSAVPGGTPLVRHPLPLHRQTEPARLRIRVPDKEQLHIYLGHLGIRRDHPDYYRLLLLDVILGGGPGFTSRLPRRLRDEMGLAYNTYAGICGTAGLDEGVFMAYIGTSPENRDAALAVIDEEIRRIRKEKVSAAELQAAKDYLTGSFVFKFETMSQIAGYLMAAHLFHLGFDYTDRYPALINQVTAEDVREAARRCLDPECCTLVEAGP